MSNKKDVEFSQDMYGQPILLDPIDPNHLKKLTHHNL